MSDLRANSQPSAEDFFAGARAFSAGRAYVTPQDVKDMAHDVLRHRILLSYEAEAEEVNTDQILDRILSKVPVP